MILSIARIIADALSPPPFDKERFRLPLPKERQYKPPTTSIPEGLTSWGNQKKSAVRLEEQATEDAPFSPTWIKIQTTKDITDRQKIADITDTDRQLLDEYADKYPNLNLTIEKLIVGKSYWIKGVSRKDAIEDLNEKGQGKGMSDKVMNVLYAIYNAGIKEAKK